MDAVENYRSASRRLLAAQMLLHRVERELNEARELLRLDRTQRLADGIKTVTENVRTLQGIIASYEMQVPIVMVPLEKGPWQKK